MDFRNFDEKSAFAKSLGDSKLDFSTDPDSISINSTNGYVTANSQNDFFEVEQVHMKDSYGGEMFTRDKEKSNDKGLSRQEGEREKGSSNEELDRHSNDSQNESDIMMNEDEMEALIAEFVMNPEFQGLDFNDMSKEEFNKLIKDKILNSGVINNEQDSKMFEYQINEIDLDPTKSNHMGTQGEYYNVDLHEHIRDVMEEVHLKSSENEYKPLGKGFECSVEEINEGKVEYVEDLPYNNQVVFEVQNAGGVVCEENYDEIEETYLERLIGLSEMFPDSLVNFTKTFSKTFMSTSLKTFSYLKTTSWVLATSFLLLSFPAVIEIESYQIESAQLAQQRQMMASSGAMMAQPGSLKPSPIPGSNPNDI